MSDMECENVQLVEEQIQEEILLLQDDVANDIAAPSTSSVNQPATKRREDLLHEVEFELQCIVDSLPMINSSAVASAEIADLSAIKLKYDRIVQQRDDIAFDRKKEFLVNFRKARTHLLELSPTAKWPEASNRFEAQHEAPYKLPSFDVPKFDGELRKWASFKAEFLSLIDDDRVRHNDSAKRRYLYMALKGEAGKLIDNLRESSFSTSWNIVCETYDQPFRRVQMHLDALLHLDASSSIRGSMVEHRQHSSGLRAAVVNLTLQLRLLSLAYKLKRMLRIFQFQEF